MEPAGRVAQDHRAGGTASGGQRGLHVGLGVEDVHGAAAAMHVARGALADQQRGGQQLLLLRLAAGEGRPDLEQRQIGKPTRLVASGGLQQPRQKVAAHMGHFRADRVLQPAGIVGAVEQLAERASMKL